MSTMMSLLFKFHGLLEVMERKNGNNQNVSNYNTPTMIFPAMLFNTKGQKSIAQAKSTITKVS